jgi:hypothetical protein
MCFGSGVADDKARVQFPRLTRRRRRRSFTAMASKLPLVGCEDTAMLPKLPALGSVSSLLFYEVASGFSGLAGSSASAWRLFSRGSPTSRGMTESDSNSAALFSKPSAICRNCR